MALRHTIFLCVAAAVVASAALLALRPAAQTPMHSVHIGSTQISVDIADTPALREQGLSGRASLSEGSGMLFVFESSGLWSFWMKDMRFPLDIIWADEQGRIVTIASGVSPDSYPKSFVPAAPVRYALEVPAGFAAAHGIVEGATMTF